EHYGMIDAPRVPARHLDAPKDLARSAREVANVDVVLDVEANAGVTQNLFRSSFGVGMLVTARLIDVQTGKTLASSFCQQISKGAWSREELMANDAEKLKAAVAERADGCIEKFKASVLMIKPRDPGSN
ncbi:MAG TPA: hypothetical protein VMH77_04110, partial [Steroidobacteraceae bacterium]|nr:hypothetical protein [Steroidobacteraceae bacterium]